jgi:hypothetical protein
MPSARCWAKTSPAVPPHDDHIVSLALPHTIDGIAHGVIIDATVDPPIANPAHATAWVPLKPWTL